MYFTQNRQEDAGPFRFRPVAGGLSRLNAYTEVVLVQWGGKPAIAKQVGRWGEGARGTGMRVDPTQPLLTQPPTSRFFQNGVGCDVGEGSTERVALPRGVDACLPLDGLMTRYSTVAAPTAKTTHPVPQHSQHQQRRHNEETCPQSSQRQKLNMPLL